MVAPLRPAARDTTVLRALCFFTTVLMGCTWRLWVGQGVFPQVPLVGFAVHCPPWIDNLTSVTLSATLIAVVSLASSPRARRMGLSLAIACLMILWLTDQHRLQPWAYHFLLAAWIFVALPAPRNLRWLRLLMVSVYVYSAFSKFDAHFLQTYGAMFVNTALQMIGRPANPAAQDTLGQWALLLPLGELGTGVLLAVRGLRGYGVLAAAVLHLSLIAMLGPWGLNHRWGVLVWNVSFLTQVILLFGPVTFAPAASAGPSERRWWPDARRAQVALVPIVLALVLPLTEPWGLWDTWLSWGLYSTRAAKLEVYLGRDDAAHLPAHIRRFCEPAGLDQAWVRLAMDRWSLETLQAPLYPHERFELAVGFAVIECLPRESQHAMAVRSSAPNRRTGTVQVTRWEGTEHLRRRAAAYRWNCRSRQPLAGP